MSFICVNEGLEDHYKDVNDERKMLEFQLERVYGIVNFRLKEKPKGKRSTLSFNIIRFRQSPR